jgi:hypothetical protein
MLEPLQRLRPPQVQDKVVLVERLELEVLA